MLKFQHAPFFKPRDLRPALQLLAAHLIPGMEMLAQLEDFPRLHLHDLVVPLDEQFGCYDKAPDVRGRPVYFRSLLQDHGLASDPP
jgi:hypothetical protein